MMEMVTIPESEYHELLRYKEIISSLEDMIHEPEFKKEFVERIKKAEERVKKEGKVQINSIQELDDEIEKLEE
jgi:hypothetical protein